MSPHTRTTCSYAIYHLTCEEMAAIEADANGRCGVCGSTDRPLNLDHDHAV